MPVDDDQFERYRFTGKVQISTGQMKNLKRPGRAVILLGDSWSRKQDGFFGL